MRSRHPTLHATMTTSVPHVVIVALILAFSFWATIAIEQRFFVDLFYSLIGFVGGWECCAIYYTWRLDSRS